ncbi:MAG: hypothetical protein U0796_02610 [Gemmatales bacterium]
MLGTGITTLNGNLNIDGATINRIVNNNSVALWDAFFTNSITGSGTWNNQNGSTFTLQNANGGTWSGTGVFNNQAGATFQKTTNVSTHNINWTFNNSGTIDAQVGTLNFSTFQMNGGTLKGAGAINLNGTTTWVAGGMSGTGTVTNNGTFTIDSSSNPSLARTFNNQGTLTQNAGSGTTLISGAFTTSGAVNVSSGTLQFSGGGSSSGSASFNVTSGATLQFSNAGFAVAGTGGITGQGNVTFSFGSATIDAPYAATGTLSIVGSTVTMNSSAAISSLQLNSFGTLQGSGNVTISGASSFGPANMGGTGTTTFNGPLTLNLSGQSIVINRTINNNGVTTWLGSSVSGTGIWNNQNGAMLDAQNDNPWDVAVNNQAGAIVRKSAGTGTTVFSRPFTNAGTVQVSSGTLQFSGSTSTSGSGAFEVTAAGTLAFSGSGFNLVPGTSITGAGNVRFDGGNSTLAGTFAAAGTVTVSGATVNFNTPAAFSSLQMNTATLQGSGDLTVTGASNLGAGGVVLAGSGSTTFNGPLTINSGGQGVSFNRTIHNNGTTTWLSGGIGGTNTWNNQNGAVLDAKSDNPWSAPFSNQFGATVRKSAGSGTTTFSGSFNNAGSVDAQSGTIAFNGGFTQSGGTTLLNGGSIDSNTPMLFNAGSLVGAGTLNASAVFTNASIVPGFSPGTITFNGSLGLGSGTTLNFELSSTSDLINVNGNLVLDGILNVTALPGFGEGTFTIIDYSGTLTNNGLDLGSMPQGFEYQIVNDSINTQINLLVVTAVPEPAEILTAATAVLTGVGTYVSWRRKRHRRRRRAHDRRHCIPG